MASEVQKGNAPEERKIQRLFRDGNVTRLIKRCNDFGAGGVSVAIGELADGLAIDLDAVRKKYDGLDGTELAISESQERMAVVVARSDADKFIAAAERENLEAYVVAEVTEEPRMVMKWRGEVIANLSRDFLNTNGAVKTAKVYVPDAPGKKENRSVECERIDDETICATYCGPTLREMAGSLKCASQRGL
ncbi:AIR synthase-related protein, partial [uncultured Alistipes sp.]|uniref:AIR synthase-related protein n=1 Tax=uncultured Alistipes sp. TaxID=538949 RepID=UPI0025A433F6